MNGFVHTTDRGDSSTEVAVSEDFHGSENEAWGRERGGRSDGSSDGAFKGKDVIGRGGCGEERGMEEREWEHSESHQKSGEAQGKK